MRTPVTVFTGSLGAGKTTVILNLVKQLPKDYKIMWLKNEYGEVSIDSELAHESNIQTTEILNGCLCCVLIGRLGDALEEISKKYKLDRLIIETAGTAYPYPIINEINKNKAFQNDGLVNIVDSLNFDFYFDNSMLAKKQAEFVDLVVINKTGLVEKERLEDVLDKIYDVYPSNAKYKTSDGFVSKDLIIGIDSKLSKDFMEPEHHHNHKDDVEVFSFEWQDKIFDLDKIEKLVNNLPKSEYYRIKGILKTNSGYTLLNFVLGKTSFQDLKKYQGYSKLTFMGKGILNQKDEIFKRL